MTLWPLAEPWTRLVPLSGADAEADTLALARLMPDATEAVAEATTTERVRRSAAEPEARPERADEASSSEALRWPEAEPDAAAGVTLGRTRAVVGAASVETILTEPVLSWAVEVSASL